MRLKLAACLAVPAMLFAELTSEGLLKHRETAKHFTLAVAEAMPADSYNTKPSEPEMNFGQWMNHIAEADGFYCARASEGKSPLPHLKDQSIQKSLAIERLNAALDFCLATIKGMSGLYLQIGGAGG